MPKIENITCHKIVNSRGDWTIQTQVTLDDGSVGEQAIPDGASKGENEAVYLPVEKAVQIVSTAVNDALKGEDPFDQTALDKMLVEMDGTENKSHLGGNSILSVSLGVAHAAAASKKIPLYKYLSELYGNTMVVDKKFPTPVFNILNGGKHAHNNLSFQEFMVIPSTSMPFNQALEEGVKIYHSLKDLLLKNGLDVDVGDEGGFAPNGLNPGKALKFISDAASQEFIPGETVFFGMDVAAGSFYKEGNYTIHEENLTMTPDELGDYYTKLLASYPVIYLEDPFHERDYTGWKNYFDKMKQKLMIVGDDLVVTNPKILKKAIDKKLINSVIVKPNQVGSLTETFEFVKMAQDAGMSICVSHRSGDTAGDTFIADLAVAVGAEFIKSGAPVRGERVAKYNRLLEIFNESKTSAGMFD